MTNNPSQTPPVETLSEEQIADLETQLDQGTGGLTLMRVVVVRALCQSLRAAWADLREGETCEFCDDPTNDEKGNPLTFLVCGRCWNANVEKNRETITALRDEAATLTTENAALREQLAEAQQRLIEYERLEKAVNAVSERVLIPEVLAAMERLKEQP